jgi:hypothetical protein
VTKHYPLKLIRYPPRSPHILDRDDHRCPKITRQLYLAYNFIIETIP